MSGRQSSLNPSTVGVGIVPRAVQTEFEKEENKIKQFESINKKFYKDIRYYIEKLDDLIKSESKMFSNISNLAQASLSTESSPTIDSSSSLASAATTASCSGFSVDEFNKEFLSKLINCRELLDEHAKSVDTFKTASSKSVADPMKSLNSIFPQVYEAIERRKTVLKELLKKQEKLDKLQSRERTGDNLVLINELKQNVDQIKQQFQKEHLFLMEELPKLYSSRIDYIKPCVNTLIGGQAKFYEEYSQFYESILKDSSGSQQQGGEGTEAHSVNAATTGLVGEHHRDYVNMPTSGADDAMTSGHVDSNVDNEVEKLSTEIQQFLKEIKSLSIVASD